MNHDNDARPLRHDERVALADGFHQAGLADLRSVLQQVGADRLEDVTVAMKPRLRELLDEQKAVHRAAGGVA